MPNAVHRSAADTHSDPESASSSQSSANTALDPFWRQMLEALPTGIAVVDAASSQTLWCNSAFAALIEQGVGVSDVIDLMPSEYLPGVEAAEWQAMLAAVLAPDYAAGQPRRVQFVDNATRNISYWDWSVQPLAGGNSPRSVMLTVQSVSEMVMNERLLASAGRVAERARQRAEALMRLTQLVNASHTTEELLKVVTTEAAAFFDTPYAAVHLLCPDSVHLETRYGLGLKPRSAGSISRTDAAGTWAARALSQRQTLVVQNYDGSAPGLPELADGKTPVAFVTSPIQQENRSYGVVEVYFAEARDVPEDARSLIAAFARQVAVALHKADLYEEIAEQRRRLQSIFDNAPASIAYFDVKGRVLAANAAAAHMYGISLDSISDATYCNVLKDLPADLFDKVRNGTPFRASHHIQHDSTGAESVCDVSLLPVRTDSGNVAGLLLLCFDVTALVAARQEADSAREAAEKALEEVRAAQTQMIQMEKMRAIGELASGVAHDFNNALMAILGYTELAEESLDEPEALTQHLAIIKKAAEDASSTVRRLQRFARQRSTMQGEPTDVNAVVQDVIEMTRPRWKDAAHREGKSYAVHADLSEVPPIIAEPSGLREVLTNIVYNALHAMPQGGILSLATRKADESDVEIEIADTGVGMTPEVASRIFDPFFTTRGVEGTGLGLAVSWSIIQRHGGTIDVKSEPGKGTHFFLRFPVGDGRPAAPAAPRSRERTPEGSASILVVDDEPFIASVLTSILTRNGYRVQSAPSAHRALEMLHEGHYDLILTDHGMPGMNGLQLVTEVKRDPSGPPIILLTGWGTSLMTTYKVETMPDAILAKPINQSDLLETIAKTIRERAEASGTAPTS
jgi:PAS domain S-box-containing protein